jgi:hypothetical protein
MLTRPRTLPTGFIQPCLPINAPRPPAGASTNPMAPVRARVCARVMGSYFEPG